MENERIFNPTDIASKFNDYFTSIGPKLAANIPSVNSTFNSFLKRPLSNSFMLFPTDRYEIENLIMNLKLGKSTGPFSVPINLLKIIKTHVSLPLSYIFNCSFSTGIVPSNLKIAQVVPFNKKGPTSYLSNYRPISLLSVFSKLLEKLMYIRLIDFLNKNNVIFPAQFGFRENHSTSHALILIVDKIQRAIEEKLVSCGIFLDFCKAFDTVDHSILLYKLQHYRIRGITIKWFNLYLKGNDKMWTPGLRTTFVDLVHGLHLWTTHEILPHRALLTQV